MFIGNLFNVYLNYFLILESVVAVKGTVAVQNVVAVEFVLYDTVTKLDCSCDHLVILLSSCNYLIQLLKNEYN